MQSPAQIARAYYIIGGVYTLSASLIWGVNTLFLMRTGHLTLLEVFIANAIFTGSMAVFELPTGILADTRGRRFSFILSVSILFVGTGLYAAVPRFGGGFRAFCVVSVLLGLGYTFYSGAVEAWVVDALNAAGHTEPLDRVMARASTISSGAMLVGTIGGGLLGNLDLTWPYIGRCALLAVALVIGMATMRDVGFSTRTVAARDIPKEMGRFARESIRFGWNVPMARLAILAGAMPAVFLEWGYHAWQPYFLGLLHSDAVWILGAIAAAIALAMMAGNSLVERLTRYCGKRTTLLLWAGAAYSVTAIGVGLAGSFAAALALYLIGMMAIGVFQPVRQGYIHLVVAKEQRATVVSLASLVGSVGSMAGQAGLGWVTATRGTLSSGYVVGGAITAIAIPLLIGMRRLGGGPDRIVGRAGRFAVCAPTTVPAGVSVAAERDIEGVSPA